MKKIKFIILLLLSGIYWIVIYLRNLFFDFGLFTQKKINVPVISIGNITVGGSGKTPTVEAIIKLLNSKNLNVAVISRGYKRNSSGLKIVSDGISILSSSQNSGDEPFQIAKKFPTTIVAVDEKRVRAANYITNKYKIDIIILDDAFQHRWIKRDLNIVLFNESILNKPKLLLPAGEYRESLNSLKRSDAIFVISNSLQNKFQIAINQIDPQKVHYCRTVLNGIQNISTKQNVKIKDLKGQNVLIFTGIANPNRVANLLKSEEIVVKYEHFYPDHYSFSNNDLSFLLNKIRSEKINFVLTTEKDYYRMPTDFFNPISELTTMGTLNISIEFKDKHAFEKLILSSTLNV
ncbi:MAG: tetraacyldisaccharide 4'-kinase [Bacteroidetes bacterium]|nr:tetraacyldisaccharide 4'-kinase [Bacteroidota bacterium]